MTNISKSLDRHTFQRDKYVERQQEAGEPINEDYLAMYENTIKQHQNKFEDPTSRIDSMEYDLLTTDWILQKTRDSKVYAQNLYAAMCNRDFQKFDIMPVLKDQRWSCSWRYAGGIIADMQQQGDYIDWYCSGIGDGLGNGGLEGYVGEGVVTDEIREDLKTLGWIVLDQDLDNY